MTQPKIARNKKGFTIIEVMIVMAIAGAIMLIVFLAVPALRRNSRNTQRRSDATNYMAAVNEFITNNNGTLPSSAANVTSVNSLVKLGISTAPTAVITGAQSAALGSADTIQLVTQAKCDPANFGNTISSTTRSFAIRFAVEGADGSPIAQCIEG